MKKKITCFGKEYNSKLELINEYGITRGMLDGRLKSGYTIEEAVTMTREEARQHSINNFKEKNKPLEKEEVIKRIESCGYKVIECNYKNNQSGILCYDENGYKVICVLDRVVTKKNRPFVFSVTSNAENFIYNINHYIKLNEIENVALDWRFGAHNHPDVLFQCKCGNTYWSNFQNWILERRVLCPICRKSISTYEQKVEKYLNEKLIPYERQYKFDDCIYKRKLPFDFYIKSLNCCIEVDGEQHFIDIPKFENRDNLNTRKMRDNIKNEYCKTNNIPLLRIPYWEFKNDNYKTIIDNFILNIN